jgi:acetyl-CoA synthetase
MLDDGVPAPFMTYGSIYEAVSDLYDGEAAWEELVTVGSPDSLNLAEEALGRHADSDEVGLRIRDFDTGASEAYSFAELDVAANRVANYLVTHTDSHARVGVMLPPSLELYAVAFGTVRAGRVWVPLDVGFGPDALTHRARDAGTSVLFTTDEHLDAVEPDRVPALDRVVAVGETTTDAESRVRVEPYATVEEEASTFGGVATHPDDVYRLAYTSGTSGRPKGAVATHGGTLRNVHPYVRYVLDLQPSDRYFVAASPAWGYGSVFGTVVPGLVGTAIGSYRGRFDPARFVETLRDWRVTNAFAPPTALRALRTSNVGVDPSGFDLRVLVTAGEALDADTATWCRERLGVRPLDTYGATEAGMLVCNYAFDDWKPKPGSMGKPLPGREVALMDDAGEEVPPGEVGAVAVARRTAPRDTHWRNPEDVLELYDGPWLRVGDLARRDEDGYYWYYARADAVINSAGHRIGPGEVEEALLKHDAVAEVCVVGVPDEMRGERVKAFVAPREGTSPSEELRSDLATFARTRLARHAYPREIEFLPALPRTTSGKVDRASLERRGSSADDR